MDKNNRIFTDPTDLGAVVLLVGCGDEDKPRRPEALHPPNGNANLADLRPMSGKLQKRIKRAFIAKPGARLTTMDLVRWCQPRLTGEVKNKHRLGIRRAAPAVAVKVGRTYPGGFIWIGKYSYQPSGDTSQPLPSDDDRE